MILLIGPFPHVPCLTSFSARVMFCTVVLPTTHVCLPRAPLFSISALPFPNQWDTFPVAIFPGSRVPFFLTRAAGRN